VVAWCARVLPSVAVESLRTWSDPRRLPGRVRDRWLTEAVLDDGLSTMTGASARSDEADVAGRVTVRRRIPYGTERGQTVDIWQAVAGASAAVGAPLMLFVPGGGWVHGRTYAQGGALLRELAAHGWVCAAVNYRVAPNHRWPTHLTDVRLALRWFIDHADDFGGSSDFVAVSGASAGGHIASLVGLERLPRRQKGSEPQVDAVVSYYGRYDWEGRDTLERARFMDFLERIVVGVRQADAPAIYAAASPIAQVTTDAPPFLVLHGTRDAVIPVQQARDFVEELRAASASPVVYAELPGAGHGFDLLDQRRAAYAARATRAFLDHVRRGVGHEQVEARSS